MYCIISVKGMEKVKFDTVINKYFDTFFVFRESLDS